MKICSPQLGLSPNSSLGGEIYDHQTLKGFCQKGIDVYVYLPKNRHYDKSLKKLHVQYCFMTHIFPPWIYSFICLPYLFRTYKKERFDILRIHSPRFLGLAAVIFHLFYPTVPILTSAVTVDNSHFFYPVEWLVFKISKQIIVQSEYMKDFLVKKYFVEKRKVTVTCGGQLPRLAKPVTPPQSIRLKSADKTMLYMGLLIKRKNPIFLIETFYQVKKLVPSLKLIVIGTGSEKKPMVKALHKLGMLDDAIFIDWAYGPQKAYWLSRMDIFVLPSKDEAFGLSVTEAMSFSKPVVVSDIRAFREIITNGKDGFTLKLDPSVWSSTIAHLLKSPKLSKNIGSSAEKTVKEKFNWEETFKLNYSVVKKMVQ